MDSKSKQKTIVVAGGGFAGLNVAVQLARQLNPSEAKVVLISKTSYHTFHPNLYEVAAAEEEFVSVSELRRSAAISYADVLPKSVEFVEGAVTSIDGRSHEITVTPVYGERAVRTIMYDYLVCAFGSTTDFFGIKGLEQHAFQLKSIPDALRIRNQLEFLVESHRMDTRKRLIRVVIGGGGFTGVELSGELVNLLDILSWKYNYPREKMELQIIEGTDSLLPGLSAEVSSGIRQRLEECGVVMRFGNFITAVSGDQITLANGEVVNYDALVWTGGVRAAAMPFVSQVQLDKKGRLPVDGYLQVPEAQDTFAIGDCACILNAEKKPLPQTAQQAMYQATYLAEALAGYVRGEEVKQFAPKDFSYIIAARGKWAVLHTPSGFVSFGLFAWIAKRFADLDYFMQLMPFWQSLRLAWFDTKIYTRND